MFRGCVVRTPSLGEVVLDEEATVVVDGATGRVARYFPTERKDDPEALAAVAAAAVAISQVLLSCVFPVCHLPTPACGQCSARPRPIIRKRLSLQALLRRWTVAAFQSRRAPRGNFRQRIYVRT